MNRALFLFIKIAFCVMLVLLILYGTIRLCYASYDYGYRMFAESTQSTQSVETTQEQE